MTRTIAIDEQPVTDAVFLRQPGESTAISLMFLLATCRAYGYDPTAEARKHYPVEHETQLSNDALTALTENLRERGPTPEALARAALPSAYDQETRRLAERVSRLEAQLRAAGMEPVAEVTA